MDDLFSMEWDVAVWQPGEEVPKLYQRGRKVSLFGAQDAVKGYVEMLAGQVGENAVQILINEDGRSQELPVNSGATSWLRQFMPDLISKAHRKRLVGPVIIQRGAALWV